MKINISSDYFLIKKSDFKDLIKIMKICLLFLFIFTFQLMAIDTNAQNAVIKLKNNTITVGQLINEIERQTDYLVVYSNREVDTDRKVDFQQNSDKVSSFLNTAFSNTDIGYNFENDYIVLSKKAHQNTIDIIRLIQANQQQGKTIKGKVTDTNGESIIGATVVEKNNPVRGTITDIDGNFTLTNIPENAILQFTYVGMKSQEVAIDRKTTIDIIMESDVELLEELVVVGYGVQKKVNLAGAVESLNAKTLESRSTNNVGLALQGIVPNLTITPGSGQADDTPGFNIRGTTSINGGDPLVIVDGIPTSTSDFSRMNSMDIESISVLKDASSAAIYGARAAFGVILVTTKKGQGEKLTIQFNNNFNVRTPTIRSAKVVLDPYIQASYKKEMGKPWYNLYTDEEVAYALKRRDDSSLPGTIVNSIDPSKYTYLDNTDWYSEVFDDYSTTNQHNLSISGATSRVSYYLGSELYQERGLLRINKDHYDRYNMRSRVEYKPTDRLTIGNNTALTYYTYEKPTNFSSWVFNTMTYTNSLVPIRNPDDSYTEEGATVIGGLADGGDSKRTNSSVYTQFTADVELVKNTWNLKADFTAKLGNSKLNEWQSDRTISYRNGPQGPDRYLGWSNYAMRTADNTSYTMFNLYTDFHKDFGIHNLSAVGGFSQEYETYEYLYGKRLDLITDSYPTPELAVGEMTINENKYAWTVRSAFYRLNYILDGKYILETNGRYDGTSRFRKDDRFGFFPSVSGAWIVSNEKFFSGLHPGFSHLKLRGSYGSLGNQAVKSYYPYISTMDAKKVEVLINNDKPMGVYPPGLVSNTLTWEKVYTLNGGVDANFFDNRLATSFDIYRRDTKDMLTKGRTLPNVIGTAEPQVNAADLKTTGWELSILWRDNITLMDKPFDYSARFVLSDSKSVITKFDNPTGYLNDYYKGSVIGEIWGLETLGFFKDQADIDNSADQWDVTSYPGDRPIEPGDLKYKDQNNDGKINRGSWTVDDPGDFKVIGNTKNRYNFGFDLNASWNGFDLRMFFQGIGKKDFYPVGYKYFGIYRAPWGNVLEPNLDHWTPENPNAHFPRLKSYLEWHEVNRDLNIPQTRYLQNAAYLRMKNITFGYTLPKTLFQNVGLYNVRVYFSGENLFEITTLHKIYDPEGLTGSSHPFLRTFSIGLNITL